MEKLGSVKKSVGKKGELLDGAAEFIEIGKKKIKLANREELLNEIQSIGLAEKAFEKAEIVEKNGKEIVQATDKDGRPRVFDMIKNAAGNFVKVAGIVVGLNLFMSCMTTGSMAYTSVDESQRNFGNRGTRTERTVRPDYEAGYNNVWEVSVADMAANNPSFIQELKDGGMSPEREPLQWAITGGKYLGDITEKLMDEDGLGNDAYTVIENDILHDMRSIVNRAGDAMERIDTDPNLMSAEELNPMIARGETSSREFQRSATLITFKEWWAAVEMAPQPTEPGRSNVGFNRAQNEFVVAKDAHMTNTRTADNAVNRLYFYTTEMVRILRGNFEALAKKSPQFAPMLQAFNANVAVLNAFAANPINEDAATDRNAARAACANLTNMLADGFDINASHMGRFWEEYTLIKTMLENIQALESYSSLHPQLKGIANILDASKPAQASEHSSGDSSISTTPGIGDGGNGGGGDGGNSNGDNNGAEQGGAGF